MRNIDEMKQPKQWPTLESAQRKKALDVIFYEILMALRISREKDQDHAGLYSATVKAALTASVLMNVRNIIEFFYKNKIRQNDYHVGRLIPVDRWLDSIPNESENPWIKDWGKWFDIEQTISQRVGHLTTHREVGEENNSWFDIEHVNSLISTIEKFLSKLGHDELKGERAQSTINELVLFKSYFPNRRIRSK
jgi:hypothetical protein